MPPETSYTRSGAVNIIYRVFGSGSHDTFLVPGWVANIDAFRQEASVVRFGEELAARASERVRTRVGHPGWREALSV